jgi:DNA mismatch repair protein MutL
MQVFVNRRRIQDFALLSGLDYGFEGLLPGGAHPYAFLFVEIDPALADFNIHPAKKEVRFRDPGSLRHAFTQALRNFLGELVRVRPESALPQIAGAEGAELFATKGGGAGGGGAAFFEPQGHRGDASGAGYHPAERQAGEAARAWGELLRERPFGREGGGEEAGAAPKEGELRYLGTALELFLVVEKAGALYLIDQHAAHERLLFDELSRGAIAIQELLVPILYTPESEAEDARLAATADRLREAGFVFERATGGNWLITALPALLAGGDAEAAIRELLAGGEEDPLRAARAMTACKAAVKDGEVLEPEAARELAVRAFALPEPRCPHGRPVWIRLGRDELFRLVRRIV